MTEAEHSKDTKPELPAHVRVRFCPSPTGTPHVGMIRTALFNWAEARATGGKLIFRIEDTDAVRDSEESYNQILESLRWLGIDWDEGIDVGGPHGPYRQSERGDIYKDVAAKLLEAGYAYESFSTPDEIKERNLAAGRPAEFGYDGYDRDLTEEQKAAFRAEGRKPALRIRMPDEDIAFDDLIRGTIEFKAGSVPDYVIVRPNGDPLYTLTNPVDDAMMDVNVVLRGEDLLSSTPRQIVLYRYLMELGIAKQMPLFGHMPYVMGQGNKKLSKRDPESNLFNHLLGEVAGMVGSLLSTEEYLEPADDARKQLKDSAADVLDAAVAALEGVDEADWKTDNLHETLNKALVEDGGYKPRLAFGPVRVAISGRRVSPPLFESMEIVGKPLTIARLKGLREHL